MMEKFMNVGTTVFWIANGIICVIGAVWSFVLAKDSI